MFVVLESRSADRTPSPEELKDMEAKVSPIPQRQIS